MSIEESETDPPSRESWEEFCRRNPDLVSGSSALLQAHYSPARLQSNIAKELFLLPDLGSAIA